MDYPSFGISMEVLMGQPIVLKIEWRKKYQSIEGLSIVITELCKKCQTCLLLMDEPSIVAMFVKLCIYGSNQASISDYKLGLSSTLILCQFKLDILSQRIYVEFLVLQHFIYPLSAMIVFILCVVIRVCIWKICRS